MRLASDYVNNNMNIFKTEVPQLMQRMMPDFNILDAIEKMTQKYEWKTILLSILFYCNKTLFPWTKVYLLNTRRCVTQSKAKKDYADFVLCKTLLLKLELEILLSCL